MAIYYKGRVLSNALINKVEATGLKTSIVELKINETLRIDLSDLPKLVKLTMYQSNLTGDIGYYEFNVKFTYNDGVNTRSWNAYGDEIEDGWTISILEDFKAFYNVNNDIIANDLGGCDGYMEVSFKYDGQGDASNDYYVCRLEEVR